MLQKILVLCHAYKLGLTEGQEVVGAKRGGKCIGIYIDDERQSSRPPGPRPAGLAANAPSAASPRFKGSTDPVFTAASCIWSVCRQSTLICRRDRALESFEASRVFTMIYNRFSHLYIATNYLPIWHIALAFNFICM